MFAHRLEARLAIVEQRLVSSSQNDEHPLLGLGFASLDLRFQIAASFSGDRLWK